MSALSSSATATYGVKAIRQMKATNTSSLPPEQTQQLARRKQRIYAFFVQKVDPILGEMITALLLQQPADVTIAMIEYLKQWSNSESVTKAGDLPSLGKPKKEMKLFLATNIAPIISKLVNRIAVKLPEDVVGFMVQELQSMQTEDALLPDQPQATVATAATVTSGSPSTEGKAAESNSNGTPPLQQQVQIAVLGAGGAGKTSIVNALQGRFDPKVKPTIGFRPLSLLLGESTQLKLYDLGGGKKIRDIWDQYYHDVHGFIYVLDAADETLLDLESESRKLFQDTLNNSFLRGKPLLIFANKQDKEGARSAATWQDVLPIPEDFQDQLFIAESTAMSSQAAEQSDDEVFKPDPNIEAGIELLCRTILDQYTTLQQRVSTDSAEKAKQEARKRLERERKVLRSKIAAAFFEHLSPELVAAQQIQADPSNIFDVVEGLAFLAAEIGYEGEPDTLPAIAQQIASSVGYQRLALQIIGALKAPISKKKTPMSWEEILALVMELRVELQLA